MWEFRTAKKKSILAIPLTFIFLLMVIQLLFGWPVREISEVAGSRITDAEGVGYRIAVKDLPESFASAHSLRVTVNGTRFHPVHSSKQVFRESDAYFVSPKSVWVAENSSDPENLSESVIVQLEWRLISDRLAFLIGLVSAICLFLLFNNDLKQFSARFGVPEILAKSPQLNSVGYVQLLFFTMLLTFLGSCVAAVAVFDDEFFSTKGFAYFSRGWNDQLAVGAATVMKSTRISAAERRMLVVGASSPREAFPSDEFIRENFSCEQVCAATSGQEMWESLALVEHFVPRQGDVIVVSVGVRRLCRPWENLKTGNIRSDLPLRSAEVDKILAANGKRVPMRSGFSDFFDNREYYFPRFRDGLWRLIQKSPTWSQPWDEVRRSYPNAPRENYAEGTERFQRVLEAYQEGISDEESQNQNFELLERIIDLGKSRKARVILWRQPLHSNLSEKLDQNAIVKVNLRLKKLASDNESVAFFDTNDFIEESEIYDHTHLYQDAVRERLAVDLFRETSL